MKEEEYLSAKKIYDEIEKLREVLNEDIWLGSIEILSTGYSTAHTKYHIPSPELTSEIIEVMRIRLATLEEQFKQM